MEHRPPRGPLGGTGDVTRAYAENDQAYASVAGEGSEEDVAESTRFTTADEPRYESGPTLGKGGMGEVILQKDLRIGRQVARKTLLRRIASVRAMSRFVREVQVQGQLEHPSVVPVYDFGTEADGTPFFTMKRVRGETLAHVLGRLTRRDPEYVARFSAHKLLASLRQVCLAIEYAHLRGVVHRDLKPGNIMLGDFGEVYVLDWGVAKLRSDQEGGASADESETPTDVAGDGEKTAADDMIGTLAYMAPEQIGAGRGHFDIRQDVFALGAILFEILTLTRYRRPGSFSTLVKNLVLEADRRSPPRPSEVASGVPPELDDACARALASHPGARLESARALAEILERYLEGDRDLAMRTTMATTLLETVRSRMALADMDPTVRIETMRDAVKALALLPDDREAQRLLLSLMVDGSGKLPPEAEREYEANDFQVDAHLLKLSILGLSAGFLTLPIALWIGIRSVPVVITLLLLNLASIGYIALILRWRTRATRHLLLLSILVAATLSLCSSWLGPFVLVPVATATLALMLATRLNPHERGWLVVIWSCAILAPFGIELLHVFPPAYSFKDGDLVLHARALFLPEVPTLVALAYTSLAYLVLPMIVVGRLRDTQRSSDRRLFAQAWYLKQLFPAAPGGGVVAVEREEPLERSRSSG